MITCFSVPENFGYIMSTKVYIVKAMVVMNRCENWTIKKSEHWRIDAFELWCWRRLEWSLDCKEIKPVNPKGNQAWIFTGRTDAEAEVPVLWPPDGKSWLTGKDPDVGRDWGQEKGGNRRWDAWMASPTSLVAQTVGLPTVWETPVQFLGREHLLEK